MVTFCDRSSIAYGIEMLRLGVIAAGLLSIASCLEAASAADYPAPPYAKAPAFAARIYDWSGLYVGVDGGYASSHQCYTVTNYPGLAGSADEGCHHATGGLFGAHIGYRWQNAAWVFGIEGQGDKADLNGSSTSSAALFSSPYTNQTKVSAVGLFTGQIGYAWQSALLYVKGGAAITNNSSSSSFPVSNFFAAANVPFNATTETRWGGAVGAGVELGFTPNWSVGVEYDHLFMGSPSVLFPPTAIAAGRTDTISQGVDIGTVRLSYRFDGPLTSW
jgi:outer membrane immunogenic protein